MSLIGIMVKVKSGDRSGIITDVLGDCHYNVNVDGREMKRHVDQMINVKKHVEESDVPQVDQQIISSTRNQHPPAYLKDFVAP